jgi:hypothetical protein
MNLPSRVERRWVTLTASMVVVAGCAVGCAVQPFFPGRVRAGSVTNGRVAGDGGGVHVERPVSRRPLLVASPQLARLGPTTPKQFLRNTRRDVIWQFMYISTEPWRWGRLKWVPRLAAP